MKSWLNKTDRTMLLPATAAEGRKWNATMFLLHNKSYDRKLRMAICSAIENGLLTYDRRADKVRLTLEGYDIALELERQQVTSN